MKIIITSGIAGALCQAITYSSTRSGNIFSSIILVLLIGSIVGMIARWDGIKTPKTSLWKIILFFICGVVFSEVAVFTYYYVQYGYNDPKLSVGIGVSFMEAGIIGILGAVSLAISAIMTGRITRVSK